MGFRRRSRFFLAIILLAGLCLVLFHSPLYHQVDYSHSIRNAPAEEIPNSPRPYINDNDTTAQPSTEKNKREEGVLAQPSTEKNKREEGVLAQPSTEKNKLEEGVLAQPSTEKNKPEEGVLAQPSTEKNKREEGVLAQPCTEKNKREEGVLAQPSTEKNKHIPPGLEKGILNLSISNSFAKEIPLNGAYWNRLLHVTLKWMDGGRNTIRSWPTCRELSHEQLLTNVHDFTSYPDLAQDFVRGINCKSPPILIDQPKKCSRSGDVQTFLLFAIKSIPWNFARRQAVRETWGKEGVHESGLRVHTVFLLGSSSLDDPDLRQLLAFEAQVFGDLLQWDFHDTIFNLTLKQHMFFKWSQENCPRVSFVFNGDDDVFANTDEILVYLKSLEPKKASQAYIGQVISTAGPLRDPKSKYYVPLSFYDGPYPSYSGGGGFLFSGALLQPLYFMSFVFPFFPIDDVFLGMCFKALGIVPMAHAGFRTFDIREQDRENICVHKHMLLVHQRSPRQIKKLWRGIRSPLLTC